jgi:hypothetical protein
VPEAVRKARRTVRRSVRQQPTDVKMGGRGSSTKRGVARLSKVSAIHNQPASAERPWQSLGWGRSVRPPGAATPQGTGRPTSGSTAWSPTLAPGTASDCDPQQLIQQRLGLADAQGEGAAQQTHHVAE